MGCCAPATTDCCGDDSNSSMIVSPLQIAKNIGYDVNDLQSIPQSSILGVGCGAPVKFAEIYEGEVVVDIGSGAGIDVFLSAMKVKDSGRVVGIGMTDEMLENPIFSEHDKITSQKQVVINGTKGLSVAFSGNGTVKGIDFTDVGSALITFRPNGFGDLKGQAVITTTGNDGGSSSTGGQEKATYTFYATGRQNANGTVNSNGATFFHANSTTGKLASIDN